MGRAPASETGGRLLKSRHGESDLVCRDGSWYLLATINSEEPPEGEVEEVIGVDLDVVNLSDAVQAPPFITHTLRSEPAQLDAVRAVSLDAPPDLPEADGSEE